MRNSHKRWSVLHQEALDDDHKYERELLMKLRQSPTSSGLNVAESNEHARYAPVVELTPAAAEALGTKANSPSPDTNRKASPAPNARDDGQTLGFAVNDSAVGSPTVKPVDRLTIQGSTPGDWRGNRDATQGRAASSIAAAADNGGVREPMGQQKSSQFETSNANTDQSTFDSEEAGG